MAEFVIEVYLPRPRRHTIASQASRLAQLAAGLTDGGTPVHCLRSLYIPENETCFFVLDADSAATVEELAARAGLARPRVIPAALAPIAGSALAREEQ